MTGVRRWSKATWLLAAILWCLGTGAASAQPSPWIPPALQDTQRLQSEARTARAQLENAESKLASAQQAVQAGLAPSPTVKEAETEVLKWSGVVKDAETRLARARLYQSLGRPVDVQFRDATIGDAAQAVSQASRLPIAVDPALRPAGRVTMTANAIPVAELLRMLAQNTKAQVAPMPDAGGVLLRPVPTLEVDGQVREFPGPIAPWSPEWFEIGGAPQQAWGGMSYMVPGGGLVHVPQGGGGFAGGGAGFSVQGGVAGGPDFPGGGVAPGGPGFQGGGVGPGGPGFQGVGPGVGRPGFGGAGAPMGMPQPGGIFGPQPEDATLAVTAVGPNRFIVATQIGRRPGAMGGRMVPLILLSLYEIRDGRMRLISTTVHDPGPVPGLAMPGSAPNGPGRMPGVPGAGPVPFRPPGSPGMAPRPPSQPVGPPPGARPVPPPGASAPGDRASDPAKPPTPEEPAPAVP